MIVIGRAELVLVSGGIRIFTNKKVIERNEGSSFS